MATKAVLDGQNWVITGQKIWTSLAHVADWCFVLARTEPGSTRSHGLSYLLVPMRQPGVTVRPIRQLTGTSEFNEVFFDGARTDAAHVVGEPGDGWRVAMATLALERGAAMLGLQVGFRRELEDLLAVARRTPARHRSAAAGQAGPGLDRPGGHPRLRSGHPGRRRPGPQASVLKILWSRWHQGLGELAMEVLGAPSMASSAGPGGRPPPDPLRRRRDLDRWQRLFLFSRAERSTAGRTRSSATSSPSRPSACPEPRMNGHRTACWTARSS